MLPPSRVDTRLFGFNRAGAESGRHDDSARPPPAVCFSEQLAHRTVEPHWPTDHGIRLKVRAARHLVLAVDGGDAPPIAVADRRLKPT